jgi:multiphosphoryl transfer protein
VESPVIERRRLDAARAEAGRELGALHDRLQTGGESSQAAIFTAHQELLSDPDVLDIAQSAIDKGRSAAAGWNLAVTTQAERLAALPNELLAARANDLRDVGRRVLGTLLGASDETRTFPDQSILIAEDLTPSDTVGLDRAKVLGFCTISGGATSHVAILARSLDLPAVAGIDPRALDVVEGTAVILDGSAGILRLNPDPTEMSRVRDRLARHAKRRAADLAAAHEPAHTKDGHRLEVVANIGGREDAEQSLRLGGEGVGLLRSEFLFLNRVTPPTEEEQFTVYRSIAETLGPNRPLIIRTLDVGGDKPLPYLSLPHEENPFLGERGLRVGLNRPDLLRTQVRAIVRAADGFPIKIMFPMVADLEEWRQARKIVEQEARSLGLAMIPAGIMVEVPSAAILAGVFAPEVDFFSIGTNDLTQYTLAMDRGHPKLAARVDAMHPAVLQMIARVVEAAKPHSRPVGICGGLASDLRGVALLVGLGVDELSVSVPALPAVRAAVRRLDLAECRDLAKRALASATAADVRRLLPVDPDA